MPQRDALVLTLFLFGSTWLTDSLQAAEPTIGDQRLKQLLMPVDSTLVQVWPNGRGPDETLEAGDETVTQKSRGGTAWNITRVTTPTLTVVRAPQDEATGMAIIVCPGGGYGGLAADHEGTRVCKWLNGLGITTVLLKYRVPRRGGEYPKHHHALQDLQRAIRLVRSNAEDWGIDPKRLGVCGFSAGGHLCTMLATNYEHESYSRLDSIDDQNSRPDFVVLTYPAYLTEPRQSNDLDPNVLNLNKTTTPPIFMSVAMDDPFARGMLNYSVKLLDAKVSVESHVYPSGGHGGGIEPDSYPMTRWVVACERWLKDIDSQLRSKD